MPITSSAKKALRASARKKVFNDRRRRAVYEVAKEYKNLVHDKKFGEAEKLLSRLYQVFDKAVKTKTFKKNTASRKKSRLVKMLGKNS